MTRLVCFMATVALLAATTSVQADITWAAGAPGGTGGGSASFDQTGGLAVLSTGIATNQLLTTGTSTCLLYTSPSPRDATLSRMPSSA